MNTLFIILAVLIVLLFIVGIICKIKKEGLRPTIVSLIVKAEEELGSNAGQEKLAYVVNTIYEMLPKSLRIFITKKAMTNFVQNVFNLVKEALDYK